MSTPSSLSQGLALLATAVERERSGRPGHNAARLSEATGIERSRVSRVTQDLRRLGFLQRDETDVLSAGPAFFQTAGSRNEPWLRAARAELRRLASRWEMTARVTVADGPRGLLLRFEAGAGARDVSVRPGQITPIWCTGAGRALLWDHSPAGLERLLSDVQFVGVGGPTAARTVGEVHALMERDRSHGVVHAAEEYVGGIHEYALPIRGGDGIIASLSVSGTAAPEPAARGIQSDLRQSADLLSSLAGEG